MEHKRSNFTGYVWSFANYQTVVAALDLLSVSRPYFTDYL